MSIHHRPFPVRSSLLYGAWQLDLQAGRRLPRASRPGQVAAGGIVASPLRRARSLGVDEPWLIMAMPLVKKELKQWINGCFSK